MLPDPNRPDARHNANPGRCCGRADKAGPERGISHGFQGFEKGAAGPVSRAFNIRAQSERWEPVFGVNCA